MSNYTNQTIGGDLNRKLGEIPSVFDWGCPSDGVSDCAVAINKAIIAISNSGGGELKLPGGYVYVVNSPIIFSGLITGQVTGNATTTVLKTSGSTPFDVSGRLSGAKITINSIIYTIDHVVDATHLVTTVAVPTGTLLDYSIDAVSNVSLVGDGVISNIYRGADMLNASSNPTVGVIDINGAYNISLSNFQINGGVSTSVGVNYSTITDPMQDDLVENSSIWIHPDSIKISIDECYFYHTGGYAVLVDSRDGNISNIKITSCTFNNNRPHLFGTSSLIYGSWTGGIHYQGDLRSSASKLFTVSDLLVDGNTFTRGTGNQVWGHGYGFDALHSNIRIVNNHFEDIGRDCVELGNTSGGVVSGNTGRRIGYICSDDTSASTPAFSAQYAVFIDTTGVQGCNYNNNSAVSVLGGFMDLDGFAYGNVSGNVFRVPSVGESEYAEDNIASWPGNFTVGIQLANNYFTPGGTNVSITGNTIINCNYGAIRLFSARGCHVTDNIINHPAGAVYAPIILGNFNPASGAGQTDTYNTDVLNNNIQWSPVTTAAAIQELEDWGAGPIIWSGGEKNWAADNRLSGNCYEFLKAASSDSTTATIISSQGVGITAQAHVKISREVFSSNNYTSMYDESGNLQWRFSDALGQLNVSNNGTNGSVTTGVRLGALAVDDTVATSHLYGDGFLTLNDSTFNNTDANVFSDNYGLIRYDSTAKTFKISTAVSAGARVWTNLSSTAPGSNTQVIFNSLGVFGASGSFTYADSTNTVTLGGGIQFAVPKIILNPYDAGSSIVLVATGASGGGPNDVYSRNIVFKTQSTSRWDINLPYSAESGSNVGSDFYIDAYNDAGSLLRHNVTIARSTGVMTVNGLGVVSSLFNSTATGSSNAIQQSSGNFSITGAGNAAFQGLTLTNALGVAYGGTGLTSVPGSSTQLIFNNSGVYDASSSLTFGSSVLTSPNFTTSGSTGTFTSTATGSNVGYSNNGSGTTFAGIYGNGQIAGQWLAFANQSGAPTAASGFAFIYPTSTALKLSLNGGTYRNLVYDTYAPTFANLNTTDSVNAIITTGSVNLGTGVTGTTVAVNIGSGTSSIRGNGDGFFQNLTVTTSLTANASVNGIITVGSVNLGTSVTGATVAVNIGGGTANITGAGDAAFQSCIVTNALTSNATGTNNCFSSPNCTINGNGAITTDICHALTYVMAGSTSITGTYYIYDSGHALQTGYTGTVASAAGRNIVGGIIV